MPEYLEFSALQTMFIVLIAIVIGVGEYCLVQVNGLNWCRQLIPSHLTKDERYAPVCKAIVYHIDRLAQLAGCTMVCLVGSMAADFFTLFAIWSGFFLVHAVKHLESIKVLRASLPE